MTNVTIRKSAPNLKEEDILTLEQQLGIRLPDGYREFLLEHNGGRPEPNVFPIQDGKGGDSVLDWFLRIQEGNLYDILDTLDTFRGRIPTNFLPIAVDAFGNLLCLSIQEPDLGKIFFWDHEKELEQYRRPGETNIALVANSFAELLDNLKPLPPI